MTQSETWLNHTIEDTIINIQGYDLYRADREFTGISTTKGGGLMIFVNSEYTVNTNEYSHLTRSTPDVESQIIKVSKQNHKSAVIINLYRPPSGSQPNFLDYVKEIIPIITAMRYSDIYLLGDLNLDHLKSKKNETTRNLEQLLKTYNLYKIIDRPTRITSKSRSLIDILYISTSKDTKPFMIKSNMSDHYVIGCIRYLAYVKTPKTSFRGRSYRKYSAQLAYEYYSKINTRYLYDLHDVNLVWKFLKKIIFRCADKLCPVRTISTRVKRLPWLTNEILELINDRDNAFQEAYDSDDLLETAKSLKTLVKRAIRTSRSNHIQSKLESCRGNPKKFWGELNQLLKRIPTHSEFNLKDEAANPIPTDQTSEHIYQFFATIGPKLAEKFNNQINNVTTNPCGEHKADSMLHFSPITSTALLKQVKAINICKSSGIDGINSRQIKDAMTFLLNEFTFLLNLSLNTGTVPDEWKTATVIPIPKTKNPSNVTDLRPISLLPLPGKILEHFIHHDLMIHLERHDLLSRKQFGFTRVCLLLMLSQPLLMMLA